jgi:hypothetical protein
LPHGGFRVADDNEQQGSAVAVDFAPARSSNFHAMIVIYEQGVCSRHMTT